MTNERQSKPAQRFSRYSRESVDDGYDLRSREDSLVDLTARALNGQRQPADLPPHAMQGESEAGPGWRQPPPPETNDLWSGEMTDRRAERREERFSRQNGEVVVDAGFPDEARQPLPSQPRQEMPDPVVQFREVPTETEQYRSEKSPRKRKEDRPKGPGKLAMITETVRAKAGPALNKSAFWLANNLRRREIRKRYNRLLVLGHTRIADRKIEQLFFVPSRRGETIDPAPDRGIHYDGPVPAQAFDWLMSMMPQDLRQFAFIDIRAGRGRASLLASKWNFHHIVAYEYDADVFDDLEMNVAQYPRSRMACRNIDCCRGDVEGIVLPDKPCIIYFSGSWREPMIAGVMNYVRDTYRQSPRRIYIVLENAAQDTAIAQDSIFDVLEPPLSERLKLKLLSPMDFKVYRSSV